MAGFLTNLFTEFSIYVYLIFILSQVSYFYQNYYLCAMRKARNLKKIKDYAYDREDILGSGAFGKVYRGRHLTTKDEVAVKVISKALRNCYKNLVKSVYMQEALIR